MASCTSVKIINQVSKWDPNGTLMHNHATPYSYVEWKNRQIWQK